MENNQTTSQVFPIFEFYALWKPMEVYGKYIVKGEYSNHPFEIGEEVTIVKSKLLVEDMPFTAKTFPDYLAKKQGDYLVTRTIWLANGIKNCAWLFGFEIEKVK